MLLIADSGSTKTTWCLLKSSGEKIIFETEGYNPWFVDEDHIFTSLSSSISTDINTNNIFEVNFYGAGCYPEKEHVIINALTRVFPNSTIIVGSDLLAAAKALLGDKPGFAAILGTGTNTGIYNGEIITHSIDSLGYILGDEGSGCAIGKKLLKDYARGILPPELQDMFFTRFQLTPYDIINQIYSKPLANRFCAGFSKFVHEHIDIEYFKDLVTISFREFFKNLVSQYEGYQQYSFNCVGSIGFVFQPILEKVTIEFDMRPGEILQAPMDLLVQYHKEKISSE